MSIIIIERLFFSLFLFCTQIKTDIKFDSFDIRLYSNPLSIGFVLFLSRFRIIWVLVYSSGGLYLPFRKLLVLFLILSFLETINIYVEHLTNKLFTARVCLIISICFMCLYNTPSHSICQYNSHTFLSIILLLF